MEPEQVPCQMDEQYKLTAIPWSLSEPPAELANAIGRIKDFASNRAPSVLLQRCDTLLYGQDLRHAWALNLLSHLVNRRWAELSDEEKQSIFSKLPRVIDFSASASEWSTKTKTAILLSQLIAKDLTGSWEKLVHAIITYGKYNDTVKDLTCDDEMKAESTIVICLRQGITVPNNGLKDKRSKTMKFESWDPLLEPLFSLLHKHLAKYDPSQNEATRLHNEFALYIAETASACARWIEVKNLVKGVGGTDFIQSCTALLSHVALIRAGLDYLSEYCSRVQSTDCDHVVWEGIFLRVLELLKNIHLDQDTKHSVCSSLVSVRKALGLHFDDLSENVRTKLEELYSAGCITKFEYTDLCDKLCDEMVG